MRSAPRLGSLCTGYSGLDMGIEAVYGGSLAWVSDIDKGACKILAHRYPDVPNLGDFTKTDWSTVEPVDLLSAGFPCQPVSGAGKGLGDKDERWLWDEVLRAVREIRPGVVILENVRGLVSRERGRLFARVLGSLAHIGYDAERGGPQHPDKRRAGGHSVGLQDALHGLTLLPTPAVNDMGEGKTIGAWDAWTAKMKARHGNGNGHGKSLAIELQRVESGWGPYAAAVAQWEQIVGRSAPSPKEPALVREWMMGLPAGWVTDVPGITHKEAVKACGNGVVPQQAEAGLRLNLDVQAAAA